MEQCKNYLKEVSLEEINQMFDDFGCYWVSMYVDRNYYSITFPLSKQVEIMEYLNKKGYKSFSNLTLVFDRQYD